MSAAVVRVEFVGQPWEISERSGVAVDARADGRPVVCIVTRDALNLAARSLRAGVSGRAGVFRQSARRFREILSVKLGEQPRVPAALITAEDLRLVRG